MNNKKSIFNLLIFLAVTATSFAQEKAITLFNGKDLKEWKQSAPVFSVKENAIVTQGKPGFLFYNGKSNQYQNFEVSCQVKTQAGAAAEILFHTGSPAGNENPKGYAIRIKNTYDGINSGEALKLTGSIDRIRNIYFPFVKDNEWFNLKIAVENKNIKVKINDILVSSYTEPENPWRPDDLKTRLLSKGTIGIHNIKGTVAFRNIELTELHDTPMESVAVDWDYDKMITELHAKNFPLTDFHVHLKGGLTIDDVVAISQQKGINYGVAANCGLRFPVTNNTELNSYLNGIEKAAIFKGMQAEGREWMTLFSPDTAARFQYIFTDAMTWTNSNGMRMRLWIPEETHVGDPEKFMEELVSKIEQILQEPIDIYVNPSYIPDEIQPRYNELWTNERMDRVIKGLVKNNVALEINARYKLPSIEFVKKAKAAGVKFTFGTNNTSKDDLDYSFCFKVVKEAGLTPSDMWMPRKPGERKIQNMKK